MQQQKTDVSVYIRNTMTNIGNNELIEKAAYVIIDRIRVLELLNGEQASTLAACAIKVASDFMGIDLSFKNVCEASEVCQISLRNMHKNIITHG